MIILQYCVMVGVWMFVQLVAAMKLIANYIWHRKWELSSEAIAFGGQSHNIIKYRIRNWKRIFASPQFGTAIEQHQNKQKLDNGRKINDHQIRAAPSKSLLFFIAHTTYTLLCCLRMCVCVFVMYVLSSSLTWSVGSSRAYKWVITSMQSDQ